MRSSPRPSCRYRLRPSIECEELQECRTRVRTRNSRNNTEGSEGTEGTAGEKVRELLGWANGSYDGDGMLGRLRGDSPIQRSQ